MKNWMNLALVATFVITGVLVWAGVKDRGVSPTMAATTAGGSETAVLPTLKIQVETVSAQQPVQTAAPLSTATLAPPATSQPEITALKPTAHDARQTMPIAARDGSASVSYIAQPGDTISKLAVDFFGSDSKANEDAILNSNPSLHQNADRILAGESYLIPARFPDAADASVSSSGPSPAVATQPEAAANVHQLRYSARPGDTVSILAGALLGSDTNEKRDAIINANPSLSADPDRVVPGKTYQIPVQSSQPLAAAPSTTHEPAAAPTTQPDADQLVLAGSTRELRYTAKDGDNVSTLAKALLGSDTKENRDAIVNSNPSLKEDPDRVLAGQTYWIPAPTALHP